MKNLKKLSALAISIMMVLSFAGCEKSDDSSKKDSSSQTETSSSAPESSSDIESSSDTDSNVAEAGLKDGVYTCEDYSIELGSDWTESKTSMSSMAMFTLGGDSTTNINIIKENVGKEITAEEYKDAAVSQFEAMSDYTVNDSKAVKINDKDAYKVYLSAKSASLKMNLIQGYIVDGSDVYVITFTTLAEQYDDIKSTVEKIIESFKVL